MSTEPRMMLNGMDSETLSRLQFKEALVARVELAGVETITVKSGNPYRAAGGRFAKKVGSSRSPLGAAVTPEIAEARASLDNLKTEESGLKTELKDLDTKIQNYERYPEEEYQAAISRRPFVLKRLEEIPSERYDLLVKGKVTSKIPVKKTKKTERHKNPSVWAINLRNEAVGLKNEKEALKLTTNKDRNKRIKEIDSRSKALKTELTKANKEKRKLQQEKDLKGLEEVGRRLDDLTN